MKSLIRAAAVLAFLSGPAMAADLVLKAPPKPVWDWTGYYVGLNIGYSWGNSDTDATFVNTGTGVVVSSSSSSFDMNGLIGGAQIGANWQNGNLVWGIEADIQASGQKGDTTFRCGPSIGCANATALLAAAQVVNVTTFEQKLDWFATLRGRLGMTFSPVMAYLTGGLALGHIKTNGTVTGFNGGGGVVGTTFSDSETTLGWTIGVGLEGRISGNWTAKVEYLYIDFGNVTTTAPFAANSPALTLNFDSHITDNILRVGLNYKF